MHISFSVGGCPVLQVLDVTQFMKYAVQSAAMFESRFNSVERILAYAKLKPEAPHHIIGKQTAPEWPQSGAISYNNVVMKYRPELEPVLKVYIALCTCCAAGCACISSCRICRAAAAASACLYALL